MDPRQDQGLPASDTAATKTQGGKGMLVMIQLKLLLLTISPRIHPPARKLQPQWLLPVRKAINPTQELVGLELCRPLHVSPTRANPAGCTSGEGQQDKAATSEGETGGSDPRPLK